MDSFIALSMSNIDTLKPFNQTRSRRFKPKKVLLKISWLSKNHHKKKKKIRKKKGVLGFEKYVFSRKKKKKYNNSMVFEKKSLKYKFFEKT